MKCITPIYALVLAALVAACTTLGVAPPKTFIESAAAAQITVTAVRQTALDLLNAGTINAKQAKTARAAADAGNQAIDLAMDVYVAACPSAGLPVAASAPAPAPCSVPAASTKLDAAVAILTAAQSILVSYTATHQGK